MAPINPKSTKKGKSNPMDTEHDERNEQNQPSCTGSVNLSDAVKANSEAIKKLQTLPDAFAELKAIILQNANYSEVDDHHISEDESQDPDQDDFNVSNEIMAMTGDALEDDISTILGQTESETDYGPDLKQEVADSFSKLIKRKESKEEFEKLKQRFKVPNNCKTLCVQKVNPEIWTALPNKARQTDYQLQSIQSYVSMTSIALAKLAEKIVLEGKQLPGNWQKELLSDILEVAKINSNTNQLIIGQRRKEMKRDMPSKETSALCSGQNEATEMLFGDNLQDKIKLAKSAINLVKPKPQFFRRPDNRFQPYKKFQGNFQRPFRGLPRGGPRPRPTLPQSTSFQNPSSSRQMPTFNQPK